jgi:hypothetical protein
MRATRCTFATGCHGNLWSTDLRLAGRSKANLTDVTNPLGQVTVGGNLTLQVTMTDKGEPGLSDTIGVTLWDGSKLLFSSHWKGSKTVEQLLAGGNLVVH